MADSYLPIFHVAIKYFNPFKAHTCFPSICQKRYGGKQPFMSEYSQNCSTRLRGLPAYGLSSTFTEHKLYYFSREMFRSTIIQSLEHMPDKCSFLFISVRIIETISVYSFEQIHFETDRKGFQKTSFSLCWVVLIEGSQQKV